eukprot:1998995-Amphidinium_carterae.1
MGVWSLLSSKQAASLKASQLSAPLAGDPSSMDTKQVRLLLGWGRVMERNLPNFTTMHAGALSMRRALAVPVGACQ